MLSVTVLVFRTYLKNNLSVHYGVVKEYRSVPFVPYVKADLTGYVVSKGMNGIFFFIDDFHADIRQNPAKRTTDLLKRVFGAK